MRPLPLDSLESFFKLLLPTLNRQRSSNGEWGWAASVWSGGACSVVCCFSASPAKDQVEAEFEAFKAELKILKELKVPQRA